MKATYAALYYGGPTYPVHESNLPELALEPVIADALKQMGKLAGGFSLDPPTFVNLEVIGNGYVIRLEHTDLKELGT